MKILAIDTATEACSAALYIDGVLSSNYQLAPREHSRLILKMIDGLLSAVNVSVEVWMPLLLARDRVLSWA